VHDYSPLNVKGLESKLFRILSSNFRSCLEKWLSTANDDKCEICNHKFQVTAKSKSFKQVIYLLLLSWKCFQNFLFVTEDPQKWGRILAHGKYLRPSLLLVERVIAYLEGAPETLG
jgi:hypothetical protein